MTELPLIARARLHPAAIAVRADSGERTYAELLERSATLAGALLEEASDLEESRIAFLVPARNFYIHRTRTSARRLFFASLIYLPALLALMMIDPTRLTSMTSR